MAYLKIRAMTGKTVGAHREYLEKDGRAAAESYYNIDREDSWEKDMIITKMLHGKTDGRQYIELIQSFEQEEENPQYTAETIHKLGQEMAEQFESDGWQIVVVTHADTEHLHNHIIINTVNSIDGKKFDMSNRERRELQSFNDELCSRYGLRTLDESKAIKDELDMKNGRQPVTRSGAEYNVNRRKMTRKDDVRQRLQAVFSATDIYSDEDFKRKLEENLLTIGRETRSGTITYVDFDGVKHRSSTLGNFGRDDVNSLVRRNLEQKNTKVPEQRENGLTEQIRVQKSHGKGGMRR